MAQEHVVSLIKKMLANDLESNLLSLPESLLSLRQLCLEPNAMIDDIEQGAAKDPAFSVYLIALSNSALYGFGKNPCENLSCAIRRLGIYSVSQFALTFALKKRHDLDNAPAELAALLKENWQSTWSLAQGATEIYWRHRQSGDSNAKRVDVSDVLILGVLVNTGRLAVITACWMLRRQGDSSEMNVSELADHLNLQLLPILFENWGLPEAQSQLYSQVRAQGESLHAIDYLLAEAMNKRYGKNKESHSASKPDYNFLAQAFDSKQVILLSERLQKMGLILIDELDFEGLDTDLTA